MNVAGGVTVGTLLQSRPETLGLDLAILAGSGGLDRRILSPYRMPVAPGRNLAILVEIAARNQLLRARGHHAAKKLADRLEHQLQRAGLDEMDESEIEDLPDSGEEQ